MERSGPDSAYSPSAADRQLARSVLAVFVVAAAVAIAGPLLSWRSDLAQLRELFHVRLAQSADAGAQALSQHLRLLEAELLRLGRRPEVDPRDETGDPERVLLDFAHHESALFGGVWVLDAYGQVVWSEPPDLFHPEREAVARSAVAQVMASRRAVVSVEPGASALLVTVPVVREGRVVGAVAGLADAAAGVVPLGPRGEGIEHALIDGLGRVLTPGALPEPGQVARGGALAGRPVSLDGGHVAAVAQVLGTELAVVAIADEESLTGPARQRFLLQLLLIGLLQIGAVLLLTFYLRRTYARFVAIERAALEQRRLAELGGAASLIAHEVKNSLNGLQAAAALLGGGPEQALPMRTLRGQIDRLRHLASSLLSFGRPAEPRLFPVSLGALVSEVVQGLATLPEAGEVEVEVAQGPLVELACDPLLATTALDNIVRNAMEAAVQAKDLGRIRNPRVSVRMERDELQARVVVEDNAGGVAREVEARLFEPFVTSKAKGIGLGLSMARRALEQQGGELTYERGAGGSRFVARFPLAGGVEAPAAGGERAVTG